MKKSMTMSTTKIESGVIVTMETSGAFVDAAALDAALRAQGIKKALPNTRPATYLRRIINELTEDGLVRKIGEDGERVSFAVVREQAEFKAADWHGQMEESITLLKGSGNVLCTKGSELGQRVINAMQGHKGGYVGSEITKIFGGVLKEHGLAFNLRSGGGVLFVPEPAREVINKLRSVVSSLGLSGCVFINSFDVVLNASTLADVQRALALRIDEEIAQLRRVVDELRNADRLNRPSSYTNKDKQCTLLIKRTLELSRMLSLDMAAQKSALKKLLGDIREGYNEAVIERENAKQNGHFAKKPKADHAQVVDADDRAARLARIKEKYAAHAAKAVR